MKDIFDCQGIAVARMGLQSCESLERDMIAGPYHPAFGELVLSRQFFKMVCSSLFAAHKDGGGGKVTIQLAERDHSLFVGMNKENIARYQRRNLLDNVEVVFNSEQPRFTAQVL